MRVALFGPDGRPAVFEGTKDEKNETLTKAVLIECFGALCGLQLRDEWQRYPGGPPAALQQLQAAIVDQVGREAIVERFKAYGVRFAQPDPGGPPTEPPVPTTTAAPPADAAPGHTDPARPFRAIDGGRMGRLPCGGRDCRRIDPPGPNGETEHHDLRDARPCPDHLSCVQHGGVHYEMPPRHGVVGHGVIRDLSDPGLGGPEGS